MINIPFKKIPKHIQRSSSIQKLPCCHCLLVHELHHTVDKTWKAKRCSKLPLIRLNLDFGWSIPRISQQQTNPLSKPIYLGKQKHEVEIASEAEVCSLQHLGAQRNKAKIGMKMESWSLARSGGGKSCITCWATKDPTKIRMMMKATVAKNLGFPKLLCISWDTKQANDQCASVWSTKSQIDGCLFQVRLNEVLVPKLLKALVFSFNELKLRKPMRCKTHKNSNITRTQEPRKGALLSQWLSYHVNKARTIHRNLKLWELFHKSQILGCRL